MKHDLKVFRQMDDRLKRTAPLLDPFLGRRQGPEKQRSRYGTRRRETADDQRAVLVGG